MIATLRRTSWPLVLLTLIGVAAPLAGYAQSPPQGALPTLPDASPAMALPPGAASPRLPGIDPRQCGTSRWAALCAQGRWAQFSRMTVTATIAGFEGNYTVEQADSGEIHVTYRERAGKAQRGGEAIVVSEDSFAYRSRDKFDDPQVILDHIMASPIRLSQLAAVLLDQAVLGPPADVGKTASVAARSTTQFIRTETAYTTTLYGPPWQVTGTVRALSPLQVAFKLRLAYRPVDASGRVLATSTTVDLAGTAIYTQRPKALNESIDLVGWKLMKKDTPMPAVATLRDAREAVGAQ
jgi:hypothetical protein